MAQSNGYLGGCNSNGRTVDVLKREHLSGRIGKVVASQAAVARSSFAEVALIYTMHEGARGVLPMRVGVRPVNWIYPL